MSFFFLSPERIFHEYGQGSCSSVYLPLPMFVYDCLKPCLVCILLFSFQRYLLPTPSPESRPTPPINPKPDPRPYSGPPPLEYVPATLRFSIRLDHDPVSESYAY